DREATPGSSRTIAPPSRGSTSSFIPRPAPIGSTRTRSPAVRGSRAFTLARRALWRRLGLIAYSRFLRRRPRNAHNRTPSGVDTGYWPRAPSVTSPSRRGAGAAPSRAVEPSEREPPEPEVVTENAAPALPSRDGFRTPAASAGSRFQPWTGERVP